MPRPLSLSIQDHLVFWRDLDWPIRWERVFDRSAELALEIGYGNGQFLLEQALAHPERDHVGIELSWSGATRLFKRLDKHDVRNVRTLLVDAEVALRRLFEPGSLHEVFVNHPCPWPKARHHRRRLLQGAGLALLADRMRTSARLTVVTDHAEYAEWLGERLQEQRALESCHATVEAGDIPGRHPTKYQLKAMARGVPIHYFEWRKARGVEGVPPPAPSPSHPMPSLTLRGAPEDPFADFEPLVLRERSDDVEVIVRLAAVYRETGRAGQADRPVWLIEALAQEGALRQDLGILVAARSPGELLVKFTDLGRPHPTHGARRAIYAVGRWIQDRHPDVRVVQENLGAPAMSPVPVTSVSEG